MVTELASKFTVLLAQEKHRLDCALGKALREGRANLVLQGYSSTDNVFLHMQQYEADIGERLATLLTTLFRLLANASAREINDNKPELEQLAKTWLQVHIDDCQTRLNELAEKNGAISPDQLDLGRDRLLNALAAELTILSATTPPAESKANRMSIDLDSLRALDPDRFELLVAEMLELSGFHNVVPFGGTGDEGIDIRAEWLEQLPTGDVLSRIWAVQCKRYSSPIGPKHIERILNAALEPPQDLLPAPPDFFLLATSSGLTVNARRVVERANGNRHKYSCRFVVWDGEAILRRIEPHERLLSKFFSPAIATPQSPRPEQVSMLRLSILIDSVEDDFVISFLCESESSSPICQRAQTKILRADFDALVDKCKSLSARPLVDRTKEDLLKQVGGAIQCLIPSSIQVTLRDHGECYIRIASNMHVVPFELAWDSATDEFLGSAKRVGRIQVADAPIRPLRVPAPSVLLIGEAEHSRFPSLPGSVEELREISALFSSWGISVTQLTGSSVSLTKIRAAIDQQSFQVVHFSGHGVANAPGGAGLVFSEGIVSLADIGRSDFGGALVFLSACSSGSALDEAARSYFQAGAIGLIGFVGPVTDRGAALIAVNFYREIGFGATLGDAMRTAREIQRRDLPDDYSWASLVLFGDPSRRVRESAQARSVPNTRPQADGTAAA
jgi:HJR/Mrr/RecB family endonuclease